MPKKETEPRRFADNYTGTYSTEVRVESEMIERLLAHVGLRSRLILKSTTVFKDRHKPEADVLVLAQAGNFFEGLGKVFSNKYSTVTFDPTSLEIVIKIHDQIIKSDLSDKDKLTLEEFTTRLDSTLRFAMMVGIYLEKISQISESLRKSLPNLLLAVATLALLFMFSEAFQGGIDLSGQVKAFYQNLIVGYVDPNNNILAYTNSNNPFPHFGNMFLSGLAACVAFLVAKNVRDKNSMLSLIDTRQNVFESFSDMIIPLQIMRLLFAGSVLSFGDDLVVKKRQES